MLPHPDYFQYFGGRAKQKGGGEDPAAMPRHGGEGGG